ncbi:MAG: type II 3-dehydroquinate dehydratase [Acidimicrobiia bacterium]
MDRYLVLNGPNLNLLGTRNPAVYGTTTLSDLDDACRDWAASLGVEVDTAQSNHEGALIDLLHQARLTHAGVVLNAGAYTHTSYAIHDAIEAISIPTMEVHISNVVERDAWRQISVLGPACVGAIYGRGVDGYRWALRHLVHRQEWPVEVMRYADHPDATIDVRRPRDDPPHAAVIFVHGGFWRHMWTKDTMEGIAIDLARRGYLTANIEYRRVGTGGGWPATLDDVAGAISHVAALEDVDRFAVIGHSAGAQLAMMAADVVDVAFLPVALGGILDMTAAVREGLDAGAVAAFLGETPPEDASPLTASVGPALVVHGSADDRVPVSHSRTFAASNPQVEYLELADVGHFEFLERSSTAWNHVVNHLAQRFGV